MWYNGKTVEILQGSAGSHTVICLGMLGALGKIALEQLEPSDMNYLRTVKYCNIKDRIRNDSIRDENVWPVTQ